MSETKPPQEEEEEEEEENLGSLLTSSISAAHEFLLRHDSAAGGLSPSLSLEVESLLSSAAVSLRRLSLPLPKPPRRHHEPLFQRLLSSPSSSHLWRRTLRLSHRSFSLLLRLLPPALPPSSVAAALFRLAHSAPYSSLRRRFSLPSSSAAAGAFFSLLRALPDSLPFPSPSSPSLLSLRRLPGGTLLQTLSDSSGRFSDVSAGWPASLSPDAVLHQTRLYLSFEESSDSAESSSSVPALFVLGQPCFPLLPWLLTPYPDPAASADPGKRAFNAAHARASAAARAAFRGLRRRWRILDGDWKEDCAEYLPFVVVACCLLHNFAVNCDEPPVEEEEEDGCSSGGEEEEEGFGVFEGEASESGERARDAVAAQLARECSES